MNKNFTKIICETENEWNNILFERDSFFKKKNVTRKMLNEAYGSIPGQFESVEIIAKKIFDLLYSSSYDKTSVKNIETEHQFKGIGKIKIKSTWYNLPSPYEKSVKAKKVYDNKVPLIVLEIYYQNELPYEIETTIAHEIMHCFQDTLPKVKGVNEKSMILYRYLPEMFNFAPSYFSRMFFYGLYICYHIEVSANVSSISNFMKRYFKDKKIETITTKEFQEALYKCDKYKIYEDVLNVLTNVQPTQKDKEYIFQKITGTFFNFFKNNEPINFYNKETFNVNKFIQENTNNIIKICKETISKMQKNIMLYKEKGE